MAGIYRLIHSESVALANMKISAVDGTAFIDFSDSETAKLIDHLGYLIKIKSDSNGAVLQGFAKAAGTGAETLSATENLSNPTFDDNSGGWGGYQGTVASSHPAGGGQSDDYCILTRSSGDSQAVYRPSSNALTIGGLYKASGYVKSGTSNDEACSIRYYDGNSSSYLGRKNSTSTSDWVQEYTYGTCLDTTQSNNQIYFHKDTATAGTMLFDTVSFKQVLTPSASGVTIVSTKGGATYNFAQKDTTFNYASATFTVEYWKVNNAVEVATGSVPAGEGKMDTTTANAFAAPESATVPFDLSAFQDGRHIYWAQDSAGKVAFAWISATAPGGETLGSEQITTWDNLTATPNVFDTLTVNANGHDIDAAIRTGAGTLSICNTGPFGAEGQLFRWLYTSTSTADKLNLIISISISGGAGDMDLADAPDGAYYRTLGGARYLLHTMDGAATATATESFKRLTDCAATGALLLSTRGGSRGYMFKDAAFNPNLALTYKILFAGDN